MKKICLLIFWYLSSVALAMEGGENSTEDLYRKAINLRNQANNVEDFQKTKTLFQEVVAMMENDKVGNLYKNQSLFTRALYNVGNCSYKIGLLYKENNTIQALEEIADAILYLSKALVVGDNFKEAYNSIEVAKKEIKILSEEISLKYNTKKENVKKALERAFTNHFKAVSAIQFCGIADKKYPQTHEGLTTKLSLWEQTSDLMVPSYKKTINNPFLQKLYLQGIIENMKKTDAMQQLLKGYGFEKNE